MIEAIFLTTLFFSILSFFGWQLARVLLKEKHIEPLIGLSCILGISLYVFAVNFLGHLFPITWVFFVALLIFLLGGGIGYLANRKGEALEWQTDMKWRRILLGTTLLLIVSTLIIAFNWSSLSLTGTKLPTAATMAEGNFPPVELWQPQYPLVFHYAAELLSAALHKVTGLPLHMAYDAQRGLLGGVLFLIGFSLLRSFFKSNAISFAGALSMMYAGTLVFLKGFSSLPVLLHMLFPSWGSGSQSLSFITDSVLSHVSVPAVMAIINKTTAIPLAFALILAISYLYLVHFRDRKKSVVGVSVLCGILLAVLALTAETYFAVLLAVIVAYPFVSYLTHKDWREVRASLAGILVIIAVAVPAALFQGGVLTGVVTGTHLALSNTEIERSFQINYRPWTFFSDIAIDFGASFILEWSLLLILLVPSVIFLYRRRPNAAIFLSLFVVISFLIPFFIVFVPRPGEIARLFYPINMIGGLIIGAWLASLYISRRGHRLVRAGVPVLFGAVMAQAVLFQLLFVSVGYPPFVWNPGGQLYAEAASLNGRAYEWVRENTSSDARFLIIRESYALTDTVPNVRFIVNTGRMAPTYVYNWPDYQKLIHGEEVHLEYPPELEVYQRITEDCDPTAIEELGFDYLFVTPEWKEGMEQKCLSHIDLTLIKEFSSPDSSLRVYSVDAD